MKKTLLVIPCLNESGRILPFLHCLKLALDKYSEVSILVVDDGSSQNEKVAINALIEDLRVNWTELLPLLSLPNNLGKGAAVYAGWDKEGASNQLLAFVDADGACPAKEVVRAIAEASAQPVDTVILASRVKMLGRVITRSWKRHLIGRVFATLVDLLLQIPVYDSQCGLKVVPQSVYRSLRERLTVFRFAFDVDLIVNLWDSKIPLMELPIDWQEVPGGKVNIIRDSWRMLVDIIAVKNRRFRAVI